jgi:hypothetical protein
LAVRSSLGIFDLAPGFVPRIVELNNSLDPLAPSRSEKISCRDWVVHQRQEESEITKMALRSTLSIALDGDGLDEDRPGQVRARDMTGSFSRPNVERLRTFEGKGSAADLDRDPAADGP